MSVNQSWEVERKKRIKPLMLRDVKTEALLVFSRTALERYFKQIDDAGYVPEVGNQEDTDYVYGTLRELNAALQENVVNVDYLLRLSDHAKKAPELRSLAKYEEPLILYYNAMAHKVAQYYNEQKAYLPEFLVISMLANWIVEDEKSIELFPFLKGIDFLDLLSRFEMNREYFEKEDGCRISELLNLSLRITDQLKKTKYKVKATRVSKTRKKR
ncbi:MAG: hypothetical protein OEW60_03265 [Thiovulaceae bacterium]|nr:hypothetical protein [Sulfurimonadaceae bacterium]